MLKNKLPLMLKSKSADLFASIQNTATVGSCAPAEEELLHNAQQSSHFAETLQLLDPCDPEGRDYGRGSRLNGKLYNASAVKYLPLKGMQLEMKDQMALRPRLRDKT